MLQRTREIGVRIALGAARSDIVQLVVRQGLAWVLVGIALGLGGAFALATTLRAMVYGMSTIDPVSLVIAISVVGVAAGLACWLPAHRATRVNPLIALRAE